MDSVKCPFCGDSHGLVRAGSLKRHVQRWHAGAPCPDCKGTGKMQVTSSVFGSSEPPKTSTIDCVRCDGGHSRPKLFLEDMVRWCTCEGGAGDDVEHSVEMRQDIYRHTKCGGVVQVG